MTWHVLPGTTQSAEQPEFGRIGFLQYELEISNSLYSLHRLLWRRPCSSMPYCIFTLILGLFEPCRSEFLIFSSVARFACTPSSTSFAPLYFLSLSDVARSASRSDWPSSVP